MKIVILGAAAGGGSPQWNCRCAVCALGWSGDPRVRRRTQVGFAVSMDETAWTLFNCSPDIREQIAANAWLQPQRGMRHSPVAEVVLTSGDVDHIGGLLSLRERHSFSIAATAGMHRILDSNSIFAVLDRTRVKRETMVPGKTHKLAGGIEIEPFLVPGKVPLYLERGEPAAGERSDATIGLEVSAGGRRFFYIPACAEIDSDLAGRLAGAELVFFDGTLWSDDEMIRSGTGPKTGRRMGHMPVGGSDGSLAALKSLGVKRLVYVHINNTNPMLIEGSPEHRTVTESGAEVGFDSQEIGL